MPCLADDIMTTVPFKQLTPNRFWLHGFAIEPVGVPVPFGAIGGVVRKPVTSTSATHVRPTARPLLCPKTPRHNHKAAHRRAHRSHISPLQRQWRRHSLAPTSRTRPGPQQGRRRECGTAWSGGERMRAEPHPPPLLLLVVVPCGAAAVRKERV